MQKNLVAITDYIHLNILVVITVCYVVGAVMAKYWPVSMGSLEPMTITLIVIFIPALLLYRKRYAPLLALPLFIGTGFINTSYSLHPPQDSTHLYNYLAERERVTLTGRITEMPEFDGLKTRFNLAADSILFHGEQPSDRALSASGKIRLTMEGEASPDLVPGNQVILLAKAGRVENFQTPGVFDYQLFSAEKGIYVSGKIESAYEIIQFQNLAAPWYAYILFAPERWRYLVAEYLDNNLDPGTVGIYQALLIGSRAKISEKILEQFKASGCMHLLAISGIHMSLLGLMVTLMLTWLMKRSTWLLLHCHVPTIATLLSIAPLILYALIAGLNTPVLRSLFMTILFLIGIVLRRQRSIIFIIAAAALFLLIWKPLALFTASFQLSFASILAIALIYPTLLKKHEQQHLSTTKTIGLYVNSTLLVSIAASLGTIPFMLYHFQRVSLISPAMNLIVEPFLCLWALPLGLLAIPFIFISPDIAAFFLKLGSWGILAADKITRAGNTLAFADIRTIIPSIPEVVIYYLLLFLVLSPVAIPHKKKIVTVSILSLLFMFTHGLMFTLQSAASQVTFLDVGQGNSTLIQHATGRTILIDGGSKTSSSFNIGERVIDPFLRKKRIWHLDDIIITHPDSDHANGIKYLLTHFKPKRLWINGDTTGEWLYSEILDKAAALGIQVIKPDTGKVIPIGTDAKLTFIQGANLNPAGLSVNDKSLVVKLEDGKNSFLFPGDISRKAEQRLVGKGAKLHADLLLAPHHGSKSSGSQEFINKVNPQTIIISAGKHSQQKYMAREHILRWRKAGRRILTTANAGTITCFSDGKTIDISTFTHGVVQ